MKQKNGHSTSFVEPRLKTTADLETALATSATGHVLHTNIGSRDFFCQQQT